MKKHWQRSAARLSSIPTRHKTDTAGFLVAVLTIAAMHAAALGSDTLVQPISGKGTLAQMADGRLATFGGATEGAAAVTAGFPAIPDDGSATPPSPSGAVSPDYLVTMTATRVRVQDRAGNVVAADTTLDAFWSPTGLTGVFGPRLLFDASAGRWYATGLANPDSIEAVVLFAISDSDDPLGGWTYFSFDADQDDFDWVSATNMGLNNQWIVITGDLTLVGGAPGRGATMWVIDKSSALAGGPLTVEFFPRRFDRVGGFNNFGLAPCVTYGPEPTLYIVDSSRILGFGVLRLSQITDDGFGTPAWSAAPGSLVATGTGIFAATLQFDTVQIDAHQLGTTIRAETGDARVQNAVYRNGSIWCAHSAGQPVNSVNRTSVLWYQINPLGMPSPILQSNIIGTGVSTHFFYPTIAVNAIDDVLLTFARSDAGHYLEIAATNRAGADPLGSMSSVVTLKAGEDVYARGASSSVAPWGPTAATLVDPFDDLGFWSLGSYAATAVGGGLADDRWGTWWTAEDVAISGACCNGGSCVDGLSVDACRGAGGSLTPGVTCADPCSCPSQAASLDPLIPDAGHGSAVRYLSLQPGNAGESKAIRVTMADLPAPYDALNGKVMWVGPPTEVTESAADVLPEDAPGDPTFMAASLECTPHYTDWGALGVVRVFHEAIVPTATYDLQIIDAACPLDNEYQYSESLLITTSRWGDLTGNCGVSPCTPPDGSVDVYSDVVGILDKFGNLPGAPVKMRADLTPETPDQRIDITDVLAAIDAFTGLPYAAPVPIICP